MKRFLHKEFIQEILNAYSVPGTHPVVLICQPYIPWGKVHSVFAWELQHSLIDVRNLLVTWCLLLHLCREIGLEVSWEGRQTLHVALLQKRACLSGLVLTLSQFNAASSLPPDFSLPPFEKRAGSWTEAGAFCLKAHYHGVTGPP